ncbi:MAG: DUF3883 domain-containing protein [Bacilli bacterium]|nr:DUF3883 domain-containing protein [Bacilli bacterium]
MSDYETSLHNLVLYLSGDEYDKETIEKDIDIFFDNSSYFSNKYNDVYKGIYSLIAKKINEYKVISSAHLSALKGNNNFDSITKLYHLYRLYPFDLNNKTDLLLFRKVFRTNDSFEIIKRILKIDKLGYDNLIANPYDIGNIETVCDALIDYDNVCAAERHQFYYNPDRRIYSDNECEEMIYEINQRIVYNQPKDYKELDENELKGKYGEYKVKKYFEHYNYIVDQVSNYGDGYGFDIALVQKDYSKVCGIEVKTTYDSYEEDQFTVSKTQLKNFEQGDTVRNFFVIRYCISEDKLYMIFKENGNFYCIDQDGNEHKVELNVETFKITKTKTKKKGEK